MCGRYTLAATWAQVHAFSQPLDLALLADELSPAYNIAPTQRSAVIVAAEDAPGGEARRFRWGLLPGWARDSRIGTRMINARLETVATKPAFRAAWKARRCLVPASGYYEWRRQGAVKQPYRVHPVEHDMLMFGGLWERWRQPDGEWLESYAIITQPAGSRMLELHDRQPLMLSGSVFQDWLHGSAADAAAIAAESTPPAIAWHPVSRAVGSVANQGAELIAPIE